MVVVRLRGGLGNQMFQYAAGRRLALQLGTELKLDARAYMAGANRHYSLSHFRVTAEVATPRKIDYWLGRGNALGRLSGQLFRRESIQRVTEQNSRFAPEVLTLPDNVYLDGYWQDERYFADASDQIRKDLTFQEPLRGRSAELAARIGACASVALHVRRGDYVDDARTNAWHGVCSKTFYRRCVARINAECENPVFFIFSDDLAWARHNLSLPGNTVFVSGNDSSQADMDLHLMSLCRHHIIANSSFSWWGAWLAEHPSQIVLAPKRWFLTLELGDRHPAPLRWERVEDAP
jgi:Glycosyl transferase family 11